MAQSSQGAKEPAVNFHPRVFATFRVAFAHVSEAKMGLLPTTAEATATASDVLRFRHAAQDSFGRFDAYVEAHCYAVLHKINSLTLISRCHPFSIRCVRLMML
jgi:hypothetical protein